MASIAPMKTRRNGWAETRCGELFVCANVTVADDTEWREHLENLRTLNRLRAPCTSMLIFGIAAAGPTAAQRQILVEEYRDISKVIRRTALLTQSFVGRGVLTAVGWLLASKVKAFAPREHLKAVAWLAEDTNFDEAEAKARLVEVVRLLGVDSKLLG